MFTYLENLRQKRAQAQTTGLDDEVIKKFLRTDARLAKAIKSAYDRYQSEEWQDFLRQAPAGEAAQIAYMQERVFNFYARPAINPYIPLGAAGSWLVTSFGAVLHDSGGYGMLGFGHCVEEVEKTLGKSHIMANIMTANIAQRKICNALDAEIGHTRTQTPVYARYLFLNSGSEAVTLASRIADLHTKKKIAGPKGVKSLTLDSSFHGRTERPARLSNMCLSAYQQHLHSFSTRDDVGVIKHNDLEQLRQNFAAAERDGIFIDALYLEPVTGEGDPGRTLSAEFYRLARELTTAAGSLLVIDSVQAGIRGYGVLSVVDYPGFQDLLPPDIETFSKAIHLGHIPLSVIAVSAAVAAEFQPGMHGNTMTANPRSLETGCHTLSLLTPEIRQNIVTKGQEFLAKAKKLQNEFPQIVTKAQGTGLLLCIGITPTIGVVGDDGLETRLRRRGIGVIHGDKNVLRFTPIFDITSAEIDLIFAVIRAELQEIKKGLR